MTPTTTHLVVGILRIFFVRRIVNSNLIHSLIELCSISALACSPILHAWGKNTKLTLFGTVFLMLGAVMFKHKEQNGMKFFPDVKHNYGNYMYDFSLMNDVDKDWKPLYKKMY